MISFLEKFGWPSFCKIALAAGVCCAVGVFPAAAQEPAQSLLPTGPVDSQHPGFMVAVVAFGQDGAVQSCRVVRSNAPFSLETSTVEHIRKHWKCPALAGVTATMPILFDPALTPKYWIDDMTPPPNLFTGGDQPQKVTLRISFGGDGWARDVQIIHPCGDPTVDNQTALWVRVHWHHAAYANLTVDAPFEFVRPPLPPPPPPLRKPDKPRPPPEPVAIPAIRVE